MPTQKVKQKRRPAVKALTMLIIATILIIIFLIIALLLAPNGKESIPEFSIIDSDGDWQANGTIAVFDNTVKPGSNGEYNFVLKNDSDKPLRYRIIFTEYLDGKKAGFEPFMRYRLKLSGVGIIDEEWYCAEDINYYGITILPGERQLVTLEYQWPFEGNNERDTLLGRVGGELSVAFDVRAEVVLDDGLYF